MPPRRNEKHSTLLPAAHIHTQSLQPTPSQSLVAAGISQSTASLPPRYTIALALPNGAPLSDTQRCEKYKQGEEFLADSWRRPGESSREGRVGDRKRKRRVAFEGDDLPSLEDGVVDLRKGGVLWYTAGLQFPCSCSLPHHPRAYTFIKSPPPDSVLPDLPPYPNPDLIPEVGAALGDWATKSQDTHTDLAPCMDELEEFEIGWKTANGSSWIIKLSPIAKASNGSALSSGTTIVESPETRRKRKGKQKALDPYTPLHFNRLSVIPETPQPISLPTISLPPTKLSTTTSRDVPADRDWIAQSKKRKLWWQSQVLHTPYSEVFNIIPRPHDVHPFPSRSNRPKTPKPPKPPDYILPRIFITPKFNPSPHPYHPSLPFYLEQNPLARLYWLIPIHGPILISTLDHTLDHKIPTPSPAILTLTLPPSFTSTSIKSKSAPIKWTPPILQYFWHKFLIPLHASGQFGDLAIRLSGPKPDPFINLIPPKPIASHVGVGVQEGYAPVRPEMGDHFRIYCDSRMVLSLRTWLNGVEIDLSRVDEGKDGMGGNERLGRGGKGVIRLFEKVRLVLVGERGEALIVA